MTTITTNVNIVGPSGALLHYEGWPVVYGTIVRRTSNPNRRRVLRPEQAAAIGETSYLAAADFVRRVTNFAQRTPDWAERIVYETKPDERWDVTLVSQRVYRRRSEFLAVMAAAGMDTCEQELTARRLVLPTERQLAELKRLSGLVTDRFVRGAAQSADPVLAR